MQFRGRRDLYNGISAVASLSVAAVTPPRRAAPISAEARLVSLSRQTAEPGRPECVWRRSVRGGPGAVRESYERSLFVQREMEFCGSRGLSPDSRCVADPGGSPAGCLFVNPLGYLFTF